MKIASFSPIQPKSIRRQLTEHLREQILSGQITPGSKLPSTAALAEEWQLPVPTVQAALTPLVKAGLLVRQAGVGTVVLDHRRTLTAVGIYFHTQTVADSSNLFLNALHAQLTQLLQAKGVEPVFISDPRPEAERDQPYLPLVQLAEKGLIRGLVATRVDYSYLSWLSKLPVATAYLSTTPMLRQRVMTNEGQLADLGLTALHQAGARRIGVIATVDKRTVDEEGYSNTTMAFWKHLQSTADNLGLQLRESWMPSLAYEYATRDIELAGYQAFKQIWAQHERPDGLLVYTDVIARGVLLAILEAGVGVPEELQLAMHQNSGLEMFCPVPATLLLTDVQAVAESLLTQVEHQFAGDEVQPIVLDYLMRQHQPVSCI
ncbi:MAG: GntR family transcriptional regulator [Armatimonadota bacterium]